MRRLDLAIDAAAEAIEKVRRREALKVVLRFGRDQSTTEEE